MLPSVIDRSIFLYLCITNKKLYTMNEIINKLNNELVERYGKVFKLYVEDDTIYFDFNGQIYEWYEEDFEDGDIYTSLLYTISDIIEEYN